MKAGKEYSLYKGLQKPLVFRAFKGKYIYYGVGSILLGLLVTMIVSALANIWYGLLTMIVIVGGGLTFTGIMQKKGLHSKKRGRGVFIVPHNYKRDVKNERI